MGTFSSPVKIDRERKSTPKTIAVFVCLCVALVAVCGIVFYKTVYPKILFNKQVSGAKETASVSSSVTAQSANDGKIDVDITERLYVSWINEVYTSTDDYLGKTVRLEGMFLSEEIGENTYRYVYRTGPGCCGNDGSMCGFEFTSADGEYPEENAWIEVVGTLDRYEENGNYYLTLSDSRVTVKTERGLEVVGNN